MFITPCPIPVEALVVLASQPHDRFDQTLPFQEVVAVNGGDAGGFQFMECHHRGSRQVDLALCKTFNGDNVKGIAVVALLPMIPLVFFMSSLFGGLQNLPFQTLGDMRISLFGGLEDFIDGFLHPLSPITITNGKLHRSLAIILVLLSTLKSFGFDWHRHVSLK